MSAGPMDAKFWELLTSVESITEEVPIELFCHRHGIGRQEFAEVEQFFLDLDYPLQIKNFEGRKVLCPRENKVEVKLDLTLLEWIALQLNFPLMGRYSEHPLFETLAKKLSEVERRYSNLDVLSLVDKERQKDMAFEGLDANHKQIVSDLTLAMESRWVVDITFIDEKTVYNFIPLRITYIDGGLSLIGEHQLDNSLSYFKITEIVSAKTVPLAEVEAKHGPLEVNQFISAIRDINGNEVRLILKIDRTQEVNLDPRHHFLGNPYVTLNGEGDFIWAASVEVSAPLFEWLYLHRSAIEIVDPKSLEALFEEYCQKKGMYYKKVA